MPRRSVPWEGRARWGCGQIDPMTREPIGVLDTGLHQAMVQTSILEADGPLQSKAGVIGALVGATDTSMDAHVDDPQVRRAQQGGPPRGQSLHEGHPGGDVPGLRKKGRVVP